MSGERVRTGWCDRRADQQIGDVIWNDGSWADFQS